MTKKPGTIKILLTLMLAFCLVFAAGCGKKTDAPAASAAETTPAVFTQTPESETAQEPGLEQEETPETGQEPEGMTEPAQKPEETQEPAYSPEEMSAGGITVEEDGEYSDKDHVALYLHVYGHLPSNYVTKKEAQAAGWNSGKGNLPQVLPGKSIGGDRYRNYEGQLPEAFGRQYYECDINYNPQGRTSGRVTRGPERIVFSNDGLIFYTEDHYRSFDQLY